VHEARCTATIQQALVAKGLPPSEHLVDAAYIDAALLVSSREELGISLIGPGRPSPAWQTKVEGAFTLERFAIDWERKQARCPQGKMSSSWSERIDRKRGRGGTDLRG
jgi:transposase